MAACSVTASLTDTRSAEHYARARRVPARRRELAGARDALDRPRPDLRRPRRGRRAHRRRRQPLRRLGLLVGPAHPRPRAPARSSPRSARPRSAGTTFGAPTAGEVDLADEVSQAHAGRPDAAHDLVGHRGVDERDPARPRRDRPHEAPEVRRRLPRPRRRPARRRRQRPRDAGHPRVARRAGRGRGEHDRRAVERPRRARRRRSPSTSSPRSSPSPTRRTWASSRRAEGFLELLRARADDNGALLVFDEVISGFRVAPRRRAGADAASSPTSRSWARSSAAACRPRPTAARASSCERIAPAGDVYQAGHAVGQPARRRGGPRHARAARRRAPYLKLAATTAALAEGLRGAADAAGYERVQIATAPGLLTVFFSAEPGDRLRGREGVRPRRLRGLVPRPARARRLRARRRSSRPGSRRSRTRPSTSRGPSPPRRPRSRRSADERDGRAPARRRPRLGHAARLPSLARRRRRSRTATTLALRRRRAARASRRTARTSRSPSRRCDEGYRLHYAQPARAAHRRSRPRAAGRRPPVRARPRAARGDRRPRRRSPSSPTSSR